jgi:hypothetical protein
MKPGMATVSAPPVRSAQQAGHCRASARSDTMQVIGAGDQGR